MYCLEPLHRGRHSVMRCIADQRWAVDRKNSEQAITYELQYFPTVSMDRVRLRIEERVEYRNQLMTWDAVRACSEATNIRRPQDSGQLFTRTTANLTGQYLGTGAWPQINIEEMAHQCALHEGVADNRHALRDARQLGDLSSGKAVDTIGCVGGCVATAMRAGDRKRKVVGATLGLQVVENREVQFVVGDVEPAPQRFTALYHPQHRVIVIRHHVDDLVLDEGLHCLPGVAPPYQRGPEKLRVKGAAMHCQSRKRKACREYPPSEFVNRLRTRRNL